MIEIGNHIFFYPSQRQRVANCVPTLALVGTRGTHNLIQTISRVNRNFAGKTKGLVVDYIGIKHKMNQALAMYSKSDANNIEDIDHSVVVVRDQLDLLSRLFHRFDTEAYFSGESLAQLDCLKKAAEFVQGTAKQEKRFMEGMKRLKAAYDICSGADELTQQERDTIHFYLAVRSIIFKLTKGNAPDIAQMNARVREMVKQALQSDGVEAVFKMGEEAASQVDIFDAAYLEKINAIQLPNTKIKLLQQLLKHAIGDLKKVNKIKGVNFTQTFQTLVNKYNERDVNVEQLHEEITDGILDLIENIKKELASNHDLAISFEEKAFYDILQALADKYNFEYAEDKLIELSKAVKTVVDDKAKYTDWSQRDDIKAELKMDLIMLLAEHGYPPDISRDEVYQDVFEQAENFKKYHS